MLPHGRDLTLVIDTCTERGVVAIFVGAQTLCIENLPIGLHNSSLLSPILERSLDQLKISVSDFKLIIVGKKGWLYENIFEKVKTMNLEKKVIFTDHVSDSELIWLYKNAFCLVLPSLYEGFGIPILEAMSNNCPTLISMNSSLPEVGGEASIYFDPKSSEDLLEKMVTLYENKGLRKELITKGKKRVKLFSWKKMAEQTLEAYEECV